MELVEDFRSLSEKILKKYNDKEAVITMGILIVDYRQTEAREYILNYLNRFDKLSGKFIDFYLPGYYMYTEDSRDNCKNRKHYNICVSKHCYSEKTVYLVRTGEKFYFDESLFNNFLYKLEEKTNIKYTYNPMLILIEIKREHYRGELEYQNKIIIELDKNSSRGLERSGILFEKIFEIAKKEVNLDKFKKHLRMRYIKGNAIKTIVDILDGGIIKAIGENIQGIMTYKIK